MKRSACLRLCVLSDLAVCPGLAQDDSFFFLQGSDPQFGMYAADRNFIQETANFEMFVATANRLKPAFVVLCGDLINQAGNASQATEFHRIAAKLDPAIKLYNVPGNHDVQNEPTPESIASYVNGFGADHYTFRHGNMVGFVLNSSVIHTPTKVPEQLAAQEKWLRAELAKAKNDGVRHLVIIQHHPWFLESPDEPDQYFNIPKERRKVYLELFKQYGVEFLFSGHYHRNAIGKDGRLTMVTTGPLGMPLGPEGSGFRIVPVCADTISQQWFGLNALANRIEVHSGALTIPANK